MSRTHIAALAFLAAGSFACQPPLAAQTQTKSGTAAVQKPAPSESPAANPVTAKPADVSSPDAIFAATYDVISGPATQKRDWDRFRSLFYPGARLVWTATKKEGGLSAKAMAPEEYVERAKSYFEKSGFFEREISRRTESWGSILHAFSTYESRHDAKDPAPFARGINSFQLFFDGTRWWIITIYWQEESPQTALPAEFLPKVM